jgi:hypothetical protein
MNDTNVNDVGGEGRMTILIPIASTVPNLAIF